MRESNRMALKEWAVVVQALAKGEQIFLLRKGGIAEEEGEFRLAAREFFLYPTWEHQQEAWIRQAHHRWLQPQYAAAWRGPVFPSLADAPQGAELSLEHYAAVTDVWPAPELARMKQLADAFVWNDAFLEKRYAYKPHLPLSVLVVRTYRLPQPLRLPYLDRYAGCRSWVELAEALPTRGAAPVLDDAEFERRRSALRDFLVGSVVSRG